jgi:hypothetical protein
MVLPKSALGAEAAPLRVNPLSGFLTNAKDASTTFDPRITAASLTRAGRLSGYALHTVAAFRRAKTHWSEERV